MDWTKLTNSIYEAAEMISRQPEIDLKQREELSKACEKLSAYLVQPRSILEKATVAMTPIVATRIAIDMGIFDYVHQPMKKEFKFDELASFTGGEPLLVGRILRSLTALGVFDVTPEGTYKCNAVVKDLAQGGYLSSQIMMNFDIHFQIFGKLPQYLKETGYKSPSNAWAGPFQHVFKTDDHYFDWLKSHPAQLDAFNRTMQAGVSRDNAARWTEIFPIEQRFQNGISLVDIGGGIGHEIKILLDTLPDLSGRFFLQDVPGVIESMLPELRTPKSRLQSVEAMPSNFFERQPIKGADFYFMGRVLHDWPDIQARKILENVRAEMNKDSVLLIHDRVLPDDTTKVQLPDTIMDFSMMILLSSLERTEMQFRELLASAGLDLVRVWRPATYGHAVIEAVRID